MMYVRCWLVLVIVFLPLVTVVALPQPALGTGGFLSGMAPPVAGGASSAPRSGRAPAPDPPLPALPPCLRSLPRPRRGPRRARGASRARAPPRPPRPLLRHPCAAPRSCACVAGRPGGAGRSRPYRSSRRHRSYLRCPWCPPSRSFRRSRLFLRCRSSRLGGRAGGSRCVRSAGPRRWRLVFTRASAAYDGGSGDQQEQAKATMRHRDLLASAGPASGGRQQLAGANW